MIVICSVPFFIKTSPKQAQNNLKPYKTLKHYKINVVNVMKYLFSRGHAILQLAVLVGPSVGPSHF